MGAAFRRTSRTQCRQRFTFPRSGVRPDWADRATSQSPFAATPLAMPGSGNVAAMADGPARVRDVHRIAASMPHVNRLEGPNGNSIDQVGGKSFVFFRTPQPDASDPQSGERYTDVMGTVALTVIAGPLN